MLINQADAAELGRMCGLYRGRYADFSVKHSHEALVREHGYTLCYTVTRLALQSAGLVAKAAVRGPCRKGFRVTPNLGAAIAQAYGAGRFHT